MESRFNALCPYHIGKCKCSFRSDGAKQSSRSVSNGTDRDTRVQPPYGIGVNPPTLRHSPTSIASMRVSRLVSCIKSLGMDSTPIVYIPSRLGHCDMLDTAADTLIQLSMGTGGDGHSIWLNIPVRMRYSQTMALLRSRLSTWNGESDLDELVGTVSLLGLIDVLTQDNVRSRDESVFEFFTHWNGVSNLLLCSSPLATGSEIARASMTLAACSTFIIPCWKGTPSPFEAQHWYDAEPAELHPTTPELRALHACSHRLFVKLPRLIALLRQLRAEYDSTTMTQAETLARDLYTCREDTAEDWLLHRVKVSTNKTDNDSKLITSAWMEFASPREMTAAVLYWQSRIITTRIYSILRQTLESYSDSSTDTLVEEMRLANNILTAYPYGRSIGYCATAPFPVGFMSVWLVYRDLPDFRGFSTLILEDWILRTLDVCQGGWCVGSTLEDLNAATEVLVGGPLVGHLCDSVRSLSTSARR